MMFQALANPFRRVARWALRAAAKNVFGYDPATWAAIGGRGGGVSSSGQTVNTDTALKIAAYKRGVQLISDYIAKTPYHVKAGNAKARNHAAWPLVRRWAEHHQLSSFQFRRSLTVAALMRGNGYGWIVRDPATARPLETRILDPDRIQPVKFRDRLVYRIRETATYLEPSDVIHIRGFGVNGYVGEDPITGYARDVLGLAQAQQNYAATYYAAGGQPSVYGYSATPLGDEQWKRLQGDVGPLRNALDDPHRIPVLEGVELKTCGLSAEQTQLLGAREFSLKDIANCLGLTVHKLNGEGTGGYKSLEEENRAFRDDTLDPFLCQFEIEYGKLLTEDEQAAELVDVEAVRESLTRTNMLDRANYLKTAIGGPWMTPAEGREVDSLEALDGADVLYPPSNMNTPVAGADANQNGGRSTPPPAAARGEALEAQVAALAQVFGRMSKRLGTQATRAAAKPQQFLEFCDQLQERNAAVIAEALGPLVQLCSARAELAGKLADAIVADFETQCRHLYDTATPDKFAAAVGELAERSEASATERARKAVALWTN